MSSSDHAAGRAQSTGTAHAVLAATAVGMTVTYAALALGTAVLARRVDPTRWRWPIDRRSNARRAGLAMRLA